MSLGVEEEVSLQINYFLQRSSEHVKRSFQKQRRRFIAEGQKNFAQVPRTPKTYIFAQKKHENFPQSRYCSLLKFLGNFSTCRFFLARKSQPYLLLSKKQDKSIRLTKKLFSFSQGVPLDT